MRIHKKLKFLQAKFYLWMTNWSTARSRILGKQ